ncbi:MAG TPA: helix-turn-helix transcriptional regulator [Planctomycetota bacterium]|nr:helix-turn-helix transcriptional regulator [Planctomycetota bacterium]
MPKQEDIRVQFGDRLRALRRHQGISQEELAARAGLDRTYVSGIERGVRNVSLRNIARLSKALAVPLKEMFEGVKGS